MKGRVDFVFLPGDKAALGNSEIAIEHRRRYGYRKITAELRGQGMQVARVVGPNGSVLGSDRDESLLVIAHGNHVPPNLRFVDGDPPEVAISRMRQTAAQGGKIAVLDYNHDITCRLRISSNSGVNAADVIAPSPTSFGRIVKRGVRIGMGTSIRTSLVAAMMIDPR